MKKLIISSMLVTGLISQPSFAEPSVTPSEMSMISVIFAPLLSSAAVSNFLKELSVTSKPMKITKVEHKANNKTAIKAGGNNTAIEFETNTYNAKAANVKENDYIYVKEGRLGFVLEANNVVLGVIPTEQNAKNFKKENLN